MSIVHAATRAPQIPPTNHAFPEAVPQAIRERLIGAGIDSLVAWSRLSRAHRAAIFGIVPAHQRMLDRLARGAP